MTLWRIRATVDDRPGYLSVLTASLALRGVNILSVQVHTTERGAVDDFLVDAPDTLDERDLVAAVERGRGRDCWVARSGARGLVDQPTRMLGLANRLVRDPDVLGELLGSLLSARSVTWRATPGPERAGPGGETMWLTDPVGGYFEVLRDVPAFTPAEFARAQALVDLAATVVRQAADRITLVLADGAELTVRPATIDDLPAVRETHERCSARTRHRRYLSGTSGPSDAQLRRLLEPASGLSLVAVREAHPGGPARVVALANLVAEGTMGELALLVEDAWQRRGVGSALLRRLVTRADQVGYAALVAHTQADNTAMLRTLYRLGQPRRVDRDGSLLTVTLSRVDAQVQRATGDAAVPVPGPAAAEA
ncbi:GNAT family N-acetyltransferase [Micromonospora sonneratiae]|uniref:GNAT family N-acetyltransferase n=1 Tax=Micromonospora sonneratiae TaxID=1184706 RepID=A0ABW3YEC9_9ACTN